MLPFDSESGRGFGSVFHHQCKSLTIFSWAFSFLARRMGFACGVQIKVVCIFYQPAAAKVGAGSTAENVLKNAEGNTVANDAGQPLRYD